jgi:sec-independent protein translocase protein TatA
MLGRLGGPELLILLAIILLVFGVGRLGRIGGELGSAIRNFREGLGSGKDEKESKDNQLKAEEAKPEERKP